MQTKNYASRKFGFSLALGSLLLCGCELKVESPPDGEIAVVSVESAGLAAPVAVPAPETPAVVQLVLPVSINAVMVDLIDPATHPIWNAAENPPVDDQAWTDLGHYANQLALAGYMITLPGTGGVDTMWVQQSEWKMYADQLKAGGMAALQATQNKDLQGIRSVGEVILATCEGCHAKFKLDVPTEGIIHLPETTQ